MLNIFFTKNSFKTFCITLTVIIILSLFFNTVINSEYGYEESTVFFNSLNEKSFLKAVFTYRDSNYISLLPHIIFRLGNFLSIDNSPSRVLIISRLISLIIGLYCILRSQIIFLNENVNYQKNLKYFLFLLTIGYFSIWSQIYWVFNSSYWLVLIIFLIYLSKNYSYDFFSYIDFLLLIACSLAKPLILLTFIFLLPPITRKAFNTKSINFFHKFCLYISFLFSIVNFVILVPNFIPFFKGEFSWVENTYLSNWSFNKYLFVFSIFSAFLYFLFKLKINDNCLSFLKVLLNKEEPKKILSLLILFIICFFITSIMYGNSRGIVAPMNAESINYLIIISIFNRFSSPLFISNYFFKASKFLYILILILVNLFYLYKVHNSYKFTFSKQSGRNFIVGDDSLSKCFMPGNLKWKFPMMRSFKERCRFYEKNKSFNTFLVDQVDSIVIKMALRNLLEPKYKSYSLNPYCTYSSYEYKGYPISINDLMFNKKNYHVFYLSKYKSNQIHRNNLNCFLNLSDQKKNITLEKESKLLNNKNHLFYFVLK